ncbi:MAG: HIT domain-containing protein [Piscirickettsiaceae bacterium]|nr:HIT domain-containing protein [Piscirickettsiaceae bacterium]
MFTLDPRLEQDTIYLGEFPLSRVLLMNDARYPWVILVPRQIGLTECFQLNKADQEQLTKESNFVAQALKELVQADKMNVAALGNVVSQLHIHHVARYQTDETWPAPVWGQGQATPYIEQEQAAICEQLKVVFAELLSNGD